MKKYFISIGLFIFILTVAGISLYFQQKNLLGSNSLSNSKNLQDYYSEAQALAEQSKSETEVTFLAVGDIMLSRNVAGETKKSGNPELPFSKTADLVANTNFNFGNLESPLSGKSFFNPTGSLVFNAPPEYVKPLAKYNFQILNLANNHAMDQGKAGLDYTQKFLDDLKVTHIGTGSTLDEAYEGRIIESNGIKIGFIGASYSSLNDNGKEKNNFVARIEDINRLQKSINKLKSQADFIVVTMHAGTEYTRTPNQDQIDFAHAAIDAGADMIIGAHPHWIQTMETYQGKYIFYSLGNFIFDQMFSQDTKEGLTLKITLTSKKTAGLPGAAKIDDLQGQRVSAKVKQIELIPVIIENYSTPRLANEQEKKNILDKIGIKNSIINLTNGQ